MRVCVQPARAVASVSRITDCGLMTSCSRSSECACVFCQHAHTTRTRTHFMATSSSAFRHVLPTVNYTHTDRASHASYAPMMTLLSSVVVVAERAGRFFWIYFAPECVRANDYVILSCFAYNYTKAHNSLLDSASAHEACHSLCMCLTYLSHPNSTAHKQQPTRRACRARAVA